jgi:hypothetical protein
MTTHTALSDAALASGQSPIISGPPDTGAPSSNLRGAKKGPARQHCGGLMETDDPTRIGILRDQREPKDLSFDQIRKPKITPGTRAKKRLMETHPSSKLAPTNCNYRHLTFSNRNYFLTFSRFISPIPFSNCQLETIRNGRNPFENNQMPFSNGSMYFTQTEPPL